MKHALIGAVVVLIIGALAYGAYWYSEQPFSVVPAEVREAVAKLVPAGPKTEYRHEMLTAESGKCFSDRKRDLVICGVRIYKDNVLMQEFSGQEVLEVLKGIPDHWEGGELITRKSWADGGLAELDYYRYNPETRSATFYFGTYHESGDAMLSTQTLDYLVVVDHVQDPKTDTDESQIRPTKYRFFSRPHIVAPWFPNCEGWLLECSASASAFAEFTSPWIRYPETIANITVNGSTATVTVTDAENRNERPRFKLDLTKPGVTEI